MAISNVGHLTSVFVDFVSFKTVDVSMDVVSQVQAQGRNYTPVLVVYTGKKVNGYKQFQCVSGHDMISACAKANLERVWVIEIPSADCI